MSIPAYIPEPEPQHSDADVVELRPERDYSTLVRGAMLSALLVLTAKVVATVFLANFEGAATEIRLWRGFVPYLAIISDPVTFRSIVTHSTIVVGVVATVYQLRPAFFARGPQFAWGRALAVILAAETYLAELIRHFFFDEVLRNDRSWYAIFAILAGAVLAAYAVRNSSEDKLKEKRPEVEIL